MTRLVLTDHAAERLAERLGWSGTKEAAAERLAQERAVRTALAMNMQHGKITLPALDIVLCLRAGVVTTITAASSRKDHLARQRSLVRKVAWSTTKTVRTGSRAKRSPRPEQDDDADPWCAVGDVASGIVARVREARDG